MMRTTTAILLLCLPLAWRSQDPKPAAQEPRAPGEPKVEAEAKPAAAPSQTAPGAPERHRYEGVYRLKRRVMNGIDDKKPNHGYLVITRRHLVLTLASPGLEEDLPLVHAGVREWRDVSDGVRTTVALEYYSDSEGAIHLMPRGRQETRTLQLVRGGLRVMQGTRSWLEFERLE